MAISSRKAGTETACPTCRTALIVPGGLPTPDESLTSQSAWSHEIQQLERVREEFANVEEEPDDDEPSLAFEVDEDPELEVGLPLSRGKMADEEMDLTPMVDVTFLLLVFFMITASFSIQKSLEIPPPEQETEGASQVPLTLEELEEEAIIVDIEEDGSVYIDEQPVSDLADLVPTLETARAANNQFEIAITVDRAAEHDTVVKVIDAANIVGMQRIRIATTQSE